MLLCRFANSISTEIDTPTNKTTDKNISKRPTISCLLENYIFISRSFRLNIDSLSINFVTVNFYYVWQSHIRIGLLCGSNCNRFSNIASMVIVGLPPDTIVAHDDSNSGMTGATIAALIFVDFFILQNIFH